MTTYMWFSTATDVTGEALAIALALTPTKQKPRNIRNGDVIIGWGAKTNEPVDLGQATVLNHPDKIRLNRNKVSALESLYGNRVTKPAISAFCTADEVMAALDRRNHSIKLPLVGRTNFHQAGKGFWLCMNKQHVERAVVDGAQYFQNYIDIMDEYRIHVAFGHVIYAAKKIENPSEAGWIAQRKEKVLEYAQRNDRNLDESTLDYVLSRLVKEVTLPDRIVQSNKRGWKFSGVNLNNVSDDLKNITIKSVEVLGLDFGAVDCAIGLDNKPYIIEINSGPGLQGTALQRYVDTFQAKLREIEAPPEPAPARRAANNRPRQMRAVGAAAADPNDGIANAGGVVRVMNNVRTDEEAQAVIAAIMRGDL
jgi:hypothetical protein